METETISVERKRQTEKHGQIHRQKGAGRYSRTDRQKATDANGRDICQSEKIDNNQTYRQTNSQRDRLSDRHTRDKQTCRQTNRQVGRQTCTQTDLESSIIRSEKDVDGLRQVREGVQS